jgi:hypothetical protein
MVEGHGNLHGLTLPRLPVPPGIRGYDPTSTDKTSAQGDRFGGRRQVDVILIPQRTGDFEVPQLVFQWYDPQTGYQSTVTPKLSLHATVGTNAAGASAASPAGQNVLESGFHPLRDTGALSSICAAGVRALPGPLSGWPLAAGFGLPPLALVGVWFSRVIRERQARAAPILRGRQAYRLARRKLNSGRDRLTASDIALTLFGYLADRLGEPVAGLAFTELHQKLLSSGAEESVAKATVAVFELAESLRYMPKGEAEGRELARLRAMAEQALEALERVLLRPSQATARKEVAA